MTADEVTKMLNTIGWMPEIEYTDITGMGEGAANVSGAITASGEGINGSTIGKIDGEVKTFQEGHIYLPTIKSATKTGSGAGAKRPKKGGGGGGGGGGGNASTHDHREKPERYHEVTKRYDRVSEALERLQKQQDKTFGATHLKNLKTEADLLKEQIKLLREK
jgi:hypothetical protein